MKKLLLLAVVVGGAFLIQAKPSFAASDGSIGATSTGSANISLSLGKISRIRNMADASFASYPGSGDLSFNQNVNISVNYASGGYRVTGSGSGAGGAFTIADGSNVIPYEVKFNDEVGVSGNVALSSGSALTGQTGAVKPISSTTNDANYAIKLAEADILAVDAGSYSGTISLVVAP